MRTQDNLDAIIRELQQNCGDLYAACRKAGLSPAFVKKWMAEDQDVNSALTNAEQVGAMAIESEAIRRAVKGYQKPVYYQGEVVGYDDVYSDGLMQTLLKKRLPERYGEDSAGVSVSVGILNQVNIMPRASTYEEWLQMKEVQLNGPAMEALPSPEQYDDAEYVELVQPERVALSIEDIDNLL